MHTGGAEPGRSVFMDSGSLAALGPGMTPAIYPFAGGASATTASVVSRRKVNVSWR
jgi:hypothetical protein